MSMNYEVNQSITMLAQMVREGAMKQAEAEAMAEKMGAALLRYEIAKEPDVSTCEDIPFPPPPVKEEHAVRMPTLDEVLKEVGIGNR